MKIRPLELLGGCFVALKELHLCTPFILTKSRRPGSRACLKRPKSIQAHRQTLSLSQDPSISPTPPNYPICVCSRVHMCVRVCSHACSACMCICAHAGVRACSHVRVHACARTCVCACLLVVVCMRWCVHVRMQLHAC